MRVKNSSITKTGCVGKRDPGLKWKTWIRIPGEPLAMFDLDKSLYLNLSFFLSDACKMNLTTFTSEDYWDIK